MRWEAVDWAELGEVLGVLLAALAGALGGVRAARRRLGEVLRQVLGPEGVKALAAEVAKALRPTLAAEAARLREQNEAAMAAAVRAAVAEEMEAQRERLREEMRELLRAHAASREEVDAVQERVARLEGSVHVLVPQARAKAR
jgi:hypothetical protein